MIGDVKMTMEIRIEFVDGCRITFSNVKDSGFEENGKMFWVSYESPEKDAGYVDYFPISVVARIQNIFHKHIVVKEE